MHIATLLGECLCAVILIECLRTVIFCRENVRCYIVMENVCVLTCYQGECVSCHVCRDIFYGECLCTDMLSGRMSVLLRFYGYLLTFPGGGGGGGVSVNVSF